jgi:hypothetical protein
VAVGEVIIPDSQSCPRNRTHLVVLVRPRPSCMQRDGDNSRMLLINQSASYRGHECLSMTHKIEGQIYANFDPALAEAVVSDHREPDQHSSKCDASS